eukprot:TRINITY_DN14892_c0_g1_i9.p1 TRINITY_DN14892_c0_g1~~TRINITY_DN14892_c0_g1_i9.p1  ORF type:complete len:751 (+),score=247.68 TRINITY_DN14892_c0_g1_i9:164-2416(+)
MCIRDSSKYYGLKKGADDPSMDTSIDGAGFDADKHVKDQFKNTNLSDMVACTDNLRSEIRKLDDGMQMMVYDNYNKFIAATDTIRNMKGKMDTFEPKIKGLDSKMESIRNISAQVNEGLSERRNKIEELHTVRSLLTKLQFLTDLPGYIHKCTQDGHWVQAVQAYNQAVPYLDKYANKHAPIGKVHQEVTSMMSALKSRMEAKLEQGTNSKGGEVALLEISECVNLLLQLKKDPKLLRAMYISSQQQSLSRKLVRVKHDISNVSTAVDRIGGVSKVYLSEFRDLVDEYQQLFMSEETAAVASDGATAQSQLVAFSQEAMGLFFDSVQAEASRDGLAPPDLLEALSTLVVDTNYLDEFIPGAQIKAMAQKIVCTVLRGRVSSAFDRNQQMVTDCLQQFDRAVGGNEPGSGEQHLSICRREYDKFTVGMQTALRNLSAFTDSRNELLDPFREDVISYILALVEELFCEIGKASLAIGEGILESGIGEGLSAVEPPYLLLVGQMIDELAQNGVGEVGMKLEQHCGKHADGRAVSLPQTLTQQLEAQRDKLVEYYVTIEGRALSETVETQVLFQTEWHKPNDGEAEAVLAGIITRKMLETSEVLEGLVPNLKFTKLSWRTLRGQVKFYNVNKSISHNIDKLFAAPAERYENRVIKLQREDILFGILGHGLKTMTECIRLQTIGIAGLHLIQIDIYILRLVLRNYVERAMDDGLDIMLDEVMNSVVDRSIMPTPLEASELESLCESKLINLVGDD